MRPINSTKKKTKNSNKFKLVAHSKWTLTIFGKKKRLVAQVCSLRKITCSH